MRLLVFRTTARSIALTAVLLGGVAACGSDGESGGESGATPDTAGSAEEGTAGDAADSTGGGGDAAESASGGSGTATLTMIDGTTYEFVMSTCETSNTDDFAIPDSYDLFGTTADGAFRFSLTRVGLDEDFITQVGALEGDFDDNGQNEQMLYSADLGTEPLTVDGAIVSGSFLMDAIGPTRPHGDQVGVILDARC